MPLDEFGLVLARGLRWRVFADGIVVHVAETCETHLLPAEFAWLLPALQGPMKEVGANGVEPTQVGPTASSPELSDAVIQRLVALRIFDRIDH